MGLSAGQLVLILLIVLVVFGGGKIPKVMGDIGKGVRNLKSGLKGDEDEQKTSAENAKIIHQEEKPLSSKSVDEKEESKTS